MMMMMMMTVITVMHHLQDAMTLAKSLRDVFVARGLKKVEKRSKWQFSYEQNSK